MFSGYFPPPIILYLMYVFRLFSSPRPPGGCQDWLRQALDDPSLLTVRRSLLQTLDTIAANATPQTTPSNTPRQTPYDTPSFTTSSDTPRHTPDLVSSVSTISSPNTSGLVTPDSPTHRGVIDTRTFVRPRKKKNSLPSKADVAIDILNDCEETNDRYV